MNRSLLPVILLFTFSAAFAQPTSWNITGIGGGGAFFAPSINPANNSEYYIASDMSELFHTTDFGQSYSQVHFLQFCGGHSSTVRFTSTANLLYAISYINDIGTPVKSTDNGVTWNTLAGNPDPSSDVYTIDVDYNNPLRVIISFYGEIYFSNDGGNTFTLFHTCLNNGAGNVVGGVFFDGNNIYAGTNDGVLVSTNAGATWSTASISGLGNGEQIFSFAAGKVGNVTRFFCLTSQAANVYVGVVGSDYWGFMAGVYSCDYGTGNRVPKMNGLTVGTDFPMFVGMAGNDINTVYLGGSNSNSYPSIKKTTNAGGLWSETFITASNQNIITGWSGTGGDRGWGYGECPFGMAVAPNNSSTLIFGDFGFVHKTSNGGTSWQQAYVNTANQHPANANTPPNQNYNSIGLENTSCWQVHFINASNIFGCYTDIRGIRSTDAGNSWSFNYTGSTANTMYRMVQGSNGTLYLGTSNIHDMYQTTRLQDGILDGADGNGKILYSTNNGQTWSLLHNFNHPVVWVALDPNNPNRAYASVIHYNGGNGTGGIYICNDLQNLSTSTWTLLADPPRTEKHPFSLVVLNDGKLVATFSGRRNSSGTFTASSGCYIYDPVGNSWTDVSDPGMDYYTKDVVVDPNDAQQNTWYVGVWSGWGGPPNGLGGLYKTTNRGASWTKLTGSTLDRVTSCTFNPNNANQIFLTTETQGLWMSSNINAPTPTFSLVNNYSFRHPERVFFNPFNSNQIWVGSFGNGMAVGTMSNTGEPDFSNPDALSIYPNPSNTNVMLSISVSSMQAPLEACYPCKIFNLFGAEVKTIQLQKGENNIDVSELTAGVYFVRVGNITKKLVIQK